MILSRSTSEEFRLFEDWKKVESEFRDCFHIRGLSGILEIALKEIEDLPLVLLFLAKVSVCLSETIPWKALVCNEHSEYSLTRCCLDQ